MGSTAGVVSLQRDLRHHPGQRIANSLAAPLGVSTLLVLTYRE